MAIPWGPIIGAGVSAIGSLFGGDDEETTTTVNYKMMARKAEQAGFNPLTAIRNGGSAGFTTTHHPGLSMAGRFGQAFQTLGNAIMSFDARADERAELEQQLMRKQLERIQRQGAMTAGLEVPTAAGSTRSTSPARSGAGGGLGIPSGPPSTIGVDEIVPPQPTDSVVRLPPNMRTGDAWSSYFGEMGDWIGGPLNAYELWRWNNPSLRSTLPSATAIFDNSVRFPSLFGDWGERNAKAFEEHLRTKKPDTWTGPGAAWGY